MRTFRLSLECIDQFAMIAKCVLLAQLHTLISTHIHLCRYRRNIPSTIRTRFRYSFERIFF